MPTESVERPPARLGVRGVLLALGIALVLLGFAYLTAPSMFAGTDFLRIHTFYKGYWSESFHAGRWLPLWNPHVNLGRPFLADPDSGMFYPPDLLYLVLDVEVAWATLAWLHIALAITGMALWLRQLGVEARTAFGLACLLPLTAPFAEVFQSGLIHYAIGLCYLPWVFLLATRLQDSPTWMSAAKLAAAVGLQYLGGHAQVSWMSWVGVSTFIFVRGLGGTLRQSLSKAGRDIFVVWGSFAWGFGVAAVQIAPTLELASQGNRHASLDFASSFSLPLAALWSFVEPAGPHFLLDTTANQFSGTAVLVAGLVGLLRVRERNTRALLALAVLAVLLALGPLTPFFRLCYVLLPGCSAFRLHAREMALVLFALMAGAGLLLSGQRREANRATLYLCVAVLLLTALLQTVWQPSSWERHWDAELYLRWFLVALTGVLLWRSLARPEKLAVGTVARVSLALVLAVELSLSLHGIKLIRASSAPSAPERELSHLLVANQLLRPNRPPPRVSFPMPYVRENAGMRIGFGTFSGYVTLTLDRVFAFMYGMRGLAEPLSNTFPADNVYGGGPFPFASMNLEVGYDPKVGQVFLNKQPDPRAYLAGNAVAVPDWREALRRMTAGHDFHRTVLLEEPLPALPEPSAGVWSGEAHIVDFAPERLRVQTRSSGAGWLVLGEAWYPGWQATVDGNPVPCLPGNVWMRVVPVPAGSHEVSLVYHSRYLGLGSAVSGGCLIALLVVALRARRPARLRAP